MDSVDRLRKITSEAAGTSLFQNRRPQRRPTWIFLQHQRSVRYAGLKAEFLGLTVAELKPARHFFAGRLRIKDLVMRPELVKLSSWTDVFVERRGIQVERLGGGVPAPPDRDWGRGQGIRPCFQMADLAEALSDCRQRGALSPAHRKKSPGEGRSSFWRRKAFAGRWANRPYTFAPTPLAGPVLDR